VKAARVEDISEFVLDGTHGSPARVEVGVPVLSAQNVKHGVLSYETDRFTNESEFRAFNSRVPLQRDDLLLTIVGTIGRAAILTDVRPLVFQRSVAIIRPKKDVIHPRYFLHATQDSRFQAQLARSTNASSQAGVYLGKLKEVKLPLPPLAEQRRIAEVLDRAEALRAKRRAALAHLDTLTQSLFLDLFGEKLTAPTIDIKSDRERVPNGCEWVLLTDVARLATGHTPDRERQDYWNGDIPWISLTDIRTLDGTIAKRTIQRVTPLGIDNSSAVRLPKGTVCFSRTASVGFVTVMGREMATSQDFMNWVCGPRIDPIFLMWALITSRPRLLALSTGSTHRTIYMRVVEQFRVLLPSIGKQREFARRVAAVEKLKAAQRAALAELDALFASLQHRAFRGEL